MTSLPPDARWRENAIRDADTIRRELLTIEGERETSGFISRRTLLKVVPALVAEMVLIERARARFLHGGGGIPASLSAITNARTGTTYQFLAQAIYTAVTGDTILIPAGTHAPAYPSTPYSDWRHLDSSYFGYTAPSGWNNMYIGPGFSSASYLTLTAVGTANNGRAVISRPYGILAADFVAGDTVMHLVDASPFASGGLTDIYAWGDGSAFSIANSVLQAYYTTVNYGTNQLTGIASWGGPTIPAGQMIVSGSVNNQALIVSAAANPGVTLNNIEFFGSAGGSGSTPSILQLSPPPGSSSTSSITLTNCYDHDNMQGIGLGYAPIGTGSFANLFDTEVYRNGWNYRTHNFYFGSIDSCTLDNVYSHHTNGTHLFKCRARMQIIHYCRIYGERSDANPGELESCNHDASNGGLIYEIGNLLQQSTNASNQMTNFCAEVSGGAAAGAMNASQVLYSVNNTRVGPSNGTGYAGTAVSWGPIKLNANYVGNPEMPLMDSTAGGSLPARQYVAANTCIGTSGGESTASPPYAFVGSGTVAEIESLSASTLATIASPIARTASNGWNCYANYADPVIYSTATFGVSQGNFWFWDSGHSEPIFTQTSGGPLVSSTGTLTNGSASVSGLSAPNSIQVGFMLYVGGAWTGLHVTDVNYAASTLALSGNWTGASGSASLTFGTFVYCGFTYQYPTGESVNLALAGMPWLGLTSEASYYDAAYNPVSSSFWNAAWIEIEPGNLLTVNAPPSGPSGATGINFYCIPLPWYSGSAYGSFGQGVDLSSFGGLGLTKQNLSGAIAFGGSWTEPTPGIIRSDDTQLNLLRQNASALTLGTPFTEASTGLVNHNPSAGALKWRRRGSFDGMDVWWTIAPTALTGYVLTAYLDGNDSGISAALVAFHGLADAAWPFDADMPAPFAAFRPPGIVSSASTHGAAIGAFRNFTGSGSVGGGFTAIISNSALTAEYLLFSTAQTNLSVTQGGTAANRVYADIIALTSGGGLDGSPLVYTGTGSSFQMTITTANAGDVLLLITGTSKNVVAVDQIGPPPFGTAVTGSPVVLVQNDIIVNFNPSPTGGILVDGVTGGYPSGPAITLTDNLIVNPFNGTSFGVPTYATVFADATQTDFAYTLKAGSPAIGAGADPGTVGGFNLAPAYQVAYVGPGLPTPGVPLPPLAARTNASWDIGGLEH